MGQHHAGIVTIWAAVMMAFVVGGVVFVTDDFRFVPPSNTVAIAIIVGLWSGTRFPHGIRWIRLGQTLTLMTSLLITLISHSNVYEIAVLTLMIGITAFYLAKALKNAQVYSPD